MIGNKYDIRSTISGSLQCEDGRIYIVVGCPGGYVRLMSWWTSGPGRTLASCRDIVLQSSLGLVAGMKNANHGLVSGLK